MKNKYTKSSLASDEFYAPKKPLFSSKEIIFRSQGRAKVFHISSNAQIIFLTLVLCIACWSFYSYHMYHKSGRILKTQSIELVETRDAYVDLMTDFMALHKNIGAMLSSMESDKSTAVKNLERYQRQAMIVEDRIKQITNEKDWVNYDEVNEKTSLSEALLQRDIAASERDALRSQITLLEETLDELKTAELEVLDKIKSLSNKELDKVKGVFSSVNTALKRKGMYFNALANSKRKDSKGGPYVPLKTRINNPQFDDNISQIFKNVDDLHYYKEVMQYIPLGKPVWSYWVTSEYGTRSDPFKKTKASHKGIDLASRTGNKINIKAKGKVTRAEFSGGYGNLVVVDHGNGFQTKYAHLNKIYVKKGEHLEIDDTIGEVGTTGRSTGPHLHYEIIYMGANVDPMPFLKAKI
ncbi:MAG: peptidoglycan DD-metalloendopeptidase family protein [Alphaproteobacteria bacterium]|nr:peptidoglycan DD-metalloendopeptidase family protein [Alphaproteobacteria bacterium]